MCSVGDDIEDHVTSKFMPETARINCTDSKCTKCRTQKPQVVLHNKYPYCKNCFIAGTVHKFKALLGKNRVIRPSDNVLICHEVGHPSTALLHFLRRGLDLTTSKKLQFNPVVIHIENVDSYCLPVVKRKQILKKIKEEVARFNFPVYFISLIDYITNPNQLESLLQGNCENINENDLERIKEMMKKKNLGETLQQEVFNIHQQDLLRNSAKYLNCRCIFTPDIGIDIASKLLTSISLGRGAHLRYDIATIDTRDSQVQVIRPLRQFTMKELAFYNIFNNLEPISFLKKARNPYLSVQNLMQKFVSDLQLNYPATVSTIVRTGDKLSINKNVEEKEKCSLCRAPIEVKSETEEAIKFSHWISTQPSDLSLPIERRANKLIENFNESRKSDYCFACNQIVNFL